MIKHALHAICAVYGPARPRVVTYNVPVFILIISGCVLALAVYLLYSKKVMKLLQGLFNFGALQQMQREGYSYYNLFSLALFAVYILSTAVFFSFLNGHLHWISPGNENLVLFSALFFVMMLPVVRKLGALVFPLLFKNRKAFADYFFYYSLSVKTTGLLLLPVCLLIYYSHLPPGYLMMAGLIITVLVFATRIMRTLLWGGSGYGVSVFHILLYLCAVEFIPLSVFIKILLSGGP